MDMSRKFRERYDTHTPVLQLLCINLCIMLDSLLQKDSTGVEPHYLDVWVPMHRDDPQSHQKLVSTNFFYSYVCIITCLIHVDKLIVVQNRYTKDLKKKHGPDIDLRSMPFDVDASYVVGRGLPHRRFVKRYELSSVKI
jgi:hypothetical protein